jgi:hypothetical protein
MLFRPLHLIGLACLLLFGCASTREKDARSAAITAQGGASIESFVSNGLTTTRIVVLRIDGVLNQPRGSKGVYPLAAGRREITANAHWSRMGVGGLFIDAAEAVLTFDAAPGTRYCLRGEKLSQASAKVWIEEAATSRRVVEATIALAANKQDVPLVIPIPVTR